MRIERSALRSALPAIRGTALALAIFAAAGIAARYTDLIDRHLIFFPDREVLQDPGDRGLEFEDVSFTASDGVRLHGWYVPGEGETTWVWFHGNAGNISHRLDNLVELHHQLGVNVFIFDYRGYGRSGGRVSEQGTYLDGEAALAYLGQRPDVDRERLVLFGRSLGCAVAVELATKHEVYAVVLESAFTSIQAMAKRAYPFLPGIGLLTRTRFDSLAKIGRVNAPVMVLHGDRDDIVPLALGQELFEGANQPKRFHVINGAGHNDTYLAGGPGYYQALARFLEDPAGGGAETALD